MKKYITLIIAFITISSFSQTAVFDISINNINATVLNGGDLFNPTGLTNGTFEVPKGSLKKTIYSAGLWIGGLDVNNNLHLTASFFRNSDEGQFLPGPVSDVNYSTKAQRYDKIFYITKSEIDFHKLHYTDKNYVASTHIADWPGNGNTSHSEMNRLAPFMDMNHNDVYEPLLGDYPLIPGDACAFTIYNAFESNGKGLNLEVHQFVYGYKDSTSVLNNTLFVSYKIFNRSGLNFHQMYVGQFIDYEIGNYLDDAACNDSLRNMMFGFNADDNDDGVNGYGLNPPAMGCKFLNQTMRSDVTFNNDFTINGNPTTTQQFYNYLRGYNKNSQPVPPINCSDKTRIDARSLGVTDSFYFYPNTSYCLTVAHIYARASSGGAQGSVDLLKTSSDFVQKYFNNGWIDDACDAYNISNGIRNRNLALNNLSIYPNPAKSFITIASKQNSERLNFIITNSLGQDIISGEINAKETIVDVSSLSPGIYFLRSGNETVKFIKE